MGSYHSSFTYLDKNSFDEGLILASFEPDDGFVDSFLAMESIYTDSYDGTHRYMYGTKYTSVATLNITFIKRDGSDFSVNENRQIFRWLTGVRSNSWLNFHANDDLDNTGRPVVSYAFFGHFSDVQQRKMDARVVGFQATFESIHPWAYSGPCVVTAPIGDRVLGINSQGILNGGTAQPRLDVDYAGILSNNPASLVKALQITDTGVVYNDYYSIRNIENNTDDLYTYTNLDVKYINQTSNCLIIHNTALDEYELLLSVTAHDFTNAYTTPKVALYYGTDYAVKFANVDYVCTPYRDDDGNVAIGNAYLLNRSKINTKEPFVMRYFKDESGLYKLEIIAEQAGKYSFSINKLKQAGFTRLDNLVDNEEITMSSGQFIVSDIPQKIFGDNFNYVFPRLRPGHNKLIIDGLGQGSIELTYRYPIKVGDCVMDIEVFGGGAPCTNQIY